MKAKKKVLSLFLVVALLAVGIGYAAVTDVLTVNGNVTIKGNAVSDFDQNVFFKDEATFVDSNAANVASTVTAWSHSLDASKDIMSLTIPEGHLLAQNDTVTATLKIENTYTSAVTIKLDALPGTDGTIMNTTTSKSPLINVTAFWVSGTARTSALDEATIPAEGEITLEVVFTVANNPESNAPRTATCALSFTATQPETP